jgi:F-type H+-transporting ATPase subunit epsilon
MATFQLDIITPERTVFSDHVELVSAPSSTGTIAILPHHVPLFTRLIEGEIKVIKPGEEYYLAIGSGFLEITPSKVTVLVTSAFRAEELNEQEILSAKKRAEEALLTRPKGDALREAQQLFMRSTIALKVLRRRRKSTLPSN